MGQSITSATLDFVILLLRISVIFFLYFFLYQVVRVIRRELQVVGTGTGGAGVLAGAAQNLYGKLIVMSSGDTGLQRGYAFELGAVNMIGRRPDSDVALNDSFLSSEHALLEWRGDSWWLEDQRSTNGTFINDIEVADPTPIVYGDIIRIGRIELKLSR
ncbi:MULTISPECIES: FHA domain-containing protein [Herpetosiphon]|uniref:FHA domain-containing protein n=2 Tax=Herpetosiphon TaxID=64 RepID=A0A0P6XYI6_9CHLR|nr:MULTISPECIES: FHA domain-containing protein [Herpetosiphon]ABX07609.1 FHA domain containing protein [Herpetosiphon aurantiacus DSM 785]MCA0353297.1 FHA domain-containing protein [Chloroflexota bacterium]KPL81326.1 hypothetical protein SE18_21925 [Herpetosiphon geysericola]MBM7841733.1 hypothetical protein [Herpetosiphon giganteus]HBW49615.1 FHA domain-containing protein [Herpetosiphon sp.]